MLSACIVCSDSLSLIWTIFCSTPSYFKRSTVALSPRPLFSSGANGVERTQGVRAVAEVALKVTVISLFAITDGGHEDLKHTTMLLAIYFQHAKCETLCGRRVLSTAKSRRRLSNILRQPHGVVDVDASGLASAACSIDSAGYDFETLCRRLCPRPAMPASLMPMSTPVVMNDGELTLSWLLITHTIFEEYLAACSTICHHAASERPILSSLPISVSLFVRHCCKSF